MAGARTCSGGQDSQSSALENDEAPSRSGPSDDPPSDSDGRSSWMRPSSSTSAVPSLPRARASAEDIRAYRVGAASGSPRASPDPSTSKPASLLTVHVCRDAGRGSARGPIGPNAVPSQSSSRATASPRCALQAPAPVLSLCVSGTFSRQVAAGAHAQRDRQRRVDSRSFAVITCTGLGLARQRSSRLCWCTASAGAASCRIW